jgi:hypothetical protein
MIYLFTATLLEKQRDAPLQNSGMQAQAKTAPPIQE